MPGPDLARARVADQQLQRRRKAITVIASRSHGCPTARLPCGTASTATAPCTGTRATAWRAFVAAAAPASSTAGLLIRSRPGDRRTVPGRAGELAAQQQPVQPVGQRAGLGAAEVLGQPPAQPTVELTAQRAQRVPHLGRQRLPDPAPEHRAQLVLGVQRHPVVHPVDAVVGADQDVPALAVGVVDHDVERGHRAQRWVVGVHQHGRLAAASRGPAAPAASPSGTASGETTSTSSTSSRVSTHRCTMPGPNGPSRNTVGGTSDQPAACDTR